MVLILMIFIFFFFIMAIYVEFKQRKKKLIKRLKDDCRRYNLSDNEKGLLSLEVEQGNEAGYEISLNKIARERLASKRRDIRSISLED